MAAGGEEGKAGCGGEGVDLYAVLGLKKECSPADLRNAYKKLALRWHPDRCSALGSSKTVEEAKNKFQAIQEAYSVLSDTNKRFLYDVGVYDSDDDANEMGDFLGEMAAMMSQTKPNEGGNETFEELQKLFVDMFQSDVGGFCSGAGGGGGGGANGANATASSRVYCFADGRDRPSTSAFSFTTVNSTSSCGGAKASAAAACGGYKRDSADMCSGKAKSVAGLGPGGAFCFGGHGRSGSAARGLAGADGGKRRCGRWPKASSPEEG